MEYKIDMLFKKIDFEKKRLENNPLRDAHSQYMSLHLSEVEMLITMYDNIQQVEDGEGDLPVVLYNAQRKFPHEYKEALKNRNEETLRKFDRSDLTIGVPVYAYDYLKGLKAKHREIIEKLSDKKSLWYDRRANLLFPGDVIRFSGNEKLYELEIVNEELGSKGDGEFISLNDCMRTYEKIDI